MAQYYQIQNLEDLKQIYTDVQVVHVSGDDVGQLLLQDDPILLNDGQQVLYQAANSSTAQPQYPQQPTTAHYIVGENLAQQQQQQQQQQAANNSGNTGAAHQQVMLHQRQSMEAQQMHQDHQMQQHIQQAAQQHHAQSIYYSSDQIITTNTSGVAPQDTLQQQLHIQQQELQHQQQLHAQQQQQQQYQTQQQVVQQHHTMQTSQQPVHVQSPPQQQHQTQQIVYRMQPQQQTSSLHQSSQIMQNAHVIVQQQQASQVLLQSPHQEIIMRQPMQQQRIIYNTNRIVYPTQTSTQAILQQQGQHQQIQIQGPLHAASQTRLLQRLVNPPSTPSQSPNTQSPPQASQQIQQSVFQQLQQSVHIPQHQTPNQGLQIQKQILQQHQPQTPPQQHHLQIQPQQQVSQTAATLIATGSPMRGILKTKTARGGLTSSQSVLVSRWPAKSNEALRPVSTQIKVPRPRNSTGQGPRARSTTRGGRGGIANIVRPAQVHLNYSPSRQVKSVNKVTVENTIGTQTQAVQTNLPQNHTTQRFKSPSPSLSSSPTTTFSSSQDPPIRTAGSNSNSNSSGSGNFELDLEDSIQAVVVKKEQQKQVGPGGTTLTTYYAKDDDDNRLARSHKGSSISLAEYIKRISNTGSVVSASPNSTSAATSTTRLTPPVRTQPENPFSDETKVSSACQTSSVSANVARANPLRSIHQQQQADAALQSNASAVHQTSHNNYEIQTQHVLQNRNNHNMGEKDRNSAKMLVILVSGEQRLITFTLPRESCTVQDLLEQVGVSFDSKTTIQCVESPGANVDFVVTVGFSVQESESELISRAEQSLQLSRQQENAQSTGGVSSALTDATGAGVSAASGTSSSGGSSINSATNSDDLTKDTSNSASNSSNTTGNKNTMADEVPRKTIQGFFAVCQSCGFSGFDHAKCERCKRIFHEPPKRMPCIRPSTSSSGSNETYSRVGDEKKRLQVASSARGRNLVTRVRGSSNSSRGRARAGRKPVVEDIVEIVSSDEEDNKSICKKDYINPSYSRKSSLLTSGYKPFSFEPPMVNHDETLVYADFERSDVTDLSDVQERLNTAVHCNIMRIGSYRFKPLEAINFTSKGVRIVAPLYSDPNEYTTINIQKAEVIKIIAHFSKTGESMLCLYTLRNCAKYIRNSLLMVEEPTGDGYSFFAPNGPYQMRKIIMQFDPISDQSRNIIRSIWDFFDEISASDAQDLLARASELEQSTGDKNKEVVKAPSPPVVHLNANESEVLFIYPSVGKGGFSVQTSDYLCLATDQYLNDIIMDFYMAWIFRNVIPEQAREKTFIFSTFFYNCLNTSLRNPTDVRLTAAQKRHARVQSWTKHVNLFEKEYIIIPINEQSHWFLAIICFPQLKGPVTYDTYEPVDPQLVKKQRGKKVSLQIGDTTITPVKRNDSGPNGGELLTLTEELLNEEDTENDEADGEESDWVSEDSKDSSTANSVGTQPHIGAIKQPLILIFDSLMGAKRNRVMVTLREYLTCEYKVKMSNSEPHVFNKENMPGHIVTVPQQNNYVDCGLYVLQYVEQFFKDPIRDYKLPIKHLSNWFDELTVTKKREDIAKLLQDIVDKKNGPNKKVILPEIPLPTENGQVVEGYKIQFEDDLDTEDVIDEDDDLTGGMGSFEMEDNISDDVKSVSKLVSPSSNNTTTTAVVPTQGGKIVLKRRLQVENTATDVGTSRSPATLKVRKVDM